LIGTSGAAIIYTTTKDILPFRRSISSFNGFFTKVSPSSTSRAKYPASSLRCSPACCRWRCERLGHPCIYPDECSDLPWRTHLVQWSGRWSVVFVRIDVYDDRTLLAFIKCSSRTVPGPLWWVLRKAAKNEA
jgi:hypothetical protein